MHNKTLHTVAFILLIVGGLNWLAVALFNWEIGLVTDNVSPMLTQVLYLLVGAAAIYELLTHKSHCRDCSSGSSM